MTTFKLLLASVPLLLSSHANAELYNVQLVFTDDTTFTGTFDYDSATQTTNNLQGKLDDVLMGNIEEIKYQLDAQSDGQGGITAYAYALETMDIETNPPINNNVMVAINFNATDPTLGATDESQLAYMDCSAGALMGNTCMYYLTWHNPIIPMAGGHGLLSQTITLANGGDTTSSYDCLFTWAENNYADLFAPAAASQSLPPYYYRYYSTQNVYLGVNTHDNHVYYLDADNTLSDVGPLSKWLPLAGCK